MLFSFFTRQLPECTHVALPEDLMFGCFLILELYWVWLACDGLCIRLELHSCFATCPLLLIAFEDGHVFLEDGEQFALSEIWVLLSGDCVSCRLLVFTFFGLKHLLSQYTT